MHALGDICKKTNQLLESIDISKQTSDVPEKFERTLRWKFCEKKNCRAFSCLFETVPAAEHLVTA